MLVFTANTLRFAFKSHLQQTRNMATLKEIQLRLKSIKNIAKITKSMKMIAATKLTRAQKAMENARVYGETSAAALNFIEPKASAESGKHIYIACSSDRGLCGAIHSTISKPIKALVRKNPDTSAVIVVGDKPKVQIVREARQNMLMSFNGVGKSVPTFSEASSIAQLICNLKLDFADGTIFYNSFKSVVAYELRKISFYTEAVVLAAEDVIQDYLQFCLANSLFHALAEGNAAEMSARRTAMENATKNAGDMIDRLTMTFNRSRQARITSDLCDIITGASAL